MADEQKPVEVIQAEPPCPFCGVGLLLAEPEPTLWRRHPDNDCILAGIAYTKYQWGRRPAAPRMSGDLVERPVRILHCNMNTISVAALERFDNPERNEDFYLVPADRIESVAAQARIWAATAREIRGKDALIRRLVEALREAERELSMYAAAEERPGTHEVLAVIRAALSEQANPAEQL